MDIVSLGEPMVEFSAASPGHLKDVTLFHRGWGGDTSNMAVAAARLGRSVGYITKIGDDAFGQCFLELWRREGVDTSKVIVEKGGFTGIYFIAYADGHEFTYYRKGSSASHISADEVDHEYIKSSRVFHSSGITQAISGSSREAVFHAIEIAKRNRALVSYDPNVRLKLWPLETARDVIIRAIGLADIVFPSIEDASMLFSSGSAKDAAERFLELGPSTVVVKLGAGGCLVATKEEIFETPSFEVNVVDATGAGDAFDAAFLSGILEGWDLRRCANFANAVGALTTTGKGAVNPIPRRSVVDDFLRSRISV